MGKLSLKKSAAGVGGTEGRNKLWKKKKKRNAATAKEMKKKKKIKEKVEEKVDPSLTGWKKKKGEWKRKREDGGKDC